MVAYKFGPYNGNEEQGSKDNTGLPTYEEAIKQGIQTPLKIENSLSHATEKLGNLGPNYPPSYTPVPKDIEFEVSKRGIMSRDPVLNKDEQLLKNFIYSNNSKPKMSINIEGYRMESYSEIVYYQEDGETKSRTELREVKEIDFELSFDVSQYISEIGMVHNPKLEGQAEEEVNQAISQYIASEKYLKELKVVKEVSWDYEALTQAITNTIRRLGYRNYITVEYPMANQRIKIQENNWANTCIHDPYCKVIQVISCLCVFTWPMAYFLKKNYAASLRSTFTMNISTNAWFDQNVQAICDKVSNVW
ncbi:hypothetical protein K502DRAFT_321051 [Neoconidiobolus thromboides FSU 785]|nr:hypothetical protein K502DRAFT_321051 [Neoconidiobolus thromboides FSU 785]